MGVLGVALRRLARWVGIDVVASLTPLGAAALVRSAKGDAVTLGAIIGGGELLLVTIALALPVLMAVVMSEMTPGLRGTVAIFLLIALSSALIMYGSFASQQSPDEDFVVSASIVLWGLLLLVAATAVAALPRVSP